MPSPWRNFITALKSLLCPSRLLFILVIFVLFAIQIARSDDSTNNETRIISSNNSSTETVLYYTLRNHSGKQTIDGYYGDLRDSPHTGLCEVKISPTGYENLTSRLPFYISDTDKELETIKEFPEQKLWQAFEQAAEESAANRVVLFVHGYNINFVKGCSRSAVFQQTLDEHTRLLLFSWPSDGTLVSYTRDEADIEWSQQPLETVIRKLVAIYGAKRLNIVAHSLGARGVVRVLQLIAREDDSKQINELVLLAPDIDAGAFRAVFPDLKKITHRISLYSSENDQPLRLSSEVHGYPRLGEAGDKMVVLKGMDTIDVSISGGREVTGHLYHLYNDTVRSDIGRLLSSGETASMRPNMKKLKKDGLPYWMLLPSSDE
ncbi:MAG: alpha/beta fold hydrolase [Pseudomonadota bacterium]|nr:alpha/beta fold hydrolase [Pseudomonadota bacterium]